MCSLLQAAFAHAPEAESKVQRAGQEAQRLKRLIGGARYLYRNGIGAKNPHILAIKALMKKSPASEKRMAKSKARAVITS